VSHATNSGIGNRARELALAHPWIEPAVFLALLHLYIWWVEPHAPWAARVAGRVVLAVFPIASSVLHRDGPRALGIRLDNLWPSLREAALATAGLSIAVLALGAVFRWPLRFELGSGVIVALYPFWAFYQQYALQALVYKRLSESVRFPRRSALLAALLFGMVHVPNPLLIGATTVAGYVWCRLYQREPNLFALTLSHAWISTLLEAQVPSAIHRGMRVGPGFWD
jgi:hypothetical protein